MAIYRGQGGAGDATGDATNQALVAQAAAESASNSATAASTSAESAAISATNALNSANNSATSASAASASQTSAATSESNASSSASSASTSATNAATSASNALTSANDSAASATLANDWATKTTGPVAGGEYSAKYNAQQAASSASSASSSASSASSSASSASTSASNAASSASSASTSATNAANSATSASGSATTATTKASEASTSASSAATSAANALTYSNNASTSATNAATSATNAASSASSASSSATSASSSASTAATSASNAATSESNTAAIYDLFDDRMLGSKASDPTLDNDGNALLEGALYWNTTTKVLRIYSGTAWQNTANASSGTVTSVDMTVPTGLQVTGNPITSAGTLAVSYAAGYSIPTNTKQGQWDTAYSWGDHATYGYATITGTQTLTNKTLTNPTINGFTGNTDVVNIGSGQFYKNASGNIGLGTTSPSYKLDIQNAGAFTGMSIGNTTTSGLTNLFIYNTVNTLTYGVSPGSSYIQYTGTGPLSFSAGGSDLFVFTQAGELGIGMTPDGSSKLQIAAGSATEAPIELTAGTLMTTPDGGSIEYDGNAFYSCPANSRRGIMPSEYFYRLNSTVAGANATGNQNIFGVGITLDASTQYEFEIQFVLSKTAGTTSHTMSLLFGGTATLNNILYKVDVIGAGNALPIALAGSFSVVTNVATATTIASAVTTAARTNAATVKGTISVNAGGTFIPQYSLSAAPGGAYTTQIGSYIKIKPIGAAGANINVGGFA